MYFGKSFLPSFENPADDDKPLKHLHAVKTAHYTAMLADGHIPLRPGSKQLVKDARAGGIQLAIATATSPEYIADLLESGLGTKWQGYFASIGCGNIVPHKKPAPNICRWVLNHLEFAPGDCIALGDSNNGLRSTLAAGIKTYITVTRYTRDQDFRAAAAESDDLGDPDALYRTAGLPLSK